jgi:prepilin-type N-terminal cleavage/methylation domain-containing protein
MNARRRPAPRGFTLVELLVVILIIALISAATLPMILTANNERRVSESARILQAILAGTRDAAIRANEPRGIRLLPDPILNGSAGGPLASNRIVPIEPAPEYSEGLVQLTASNTIPNTQLAAIMAVEVTSTPSVQGNAAILSNPTSWYWNIRQGDKIRFNDSGAYYTIAGPMQVGALNGNSERFINLGQAATTFGMQRPNEFLILTNGVDDDGDGFVDNGFDGLDNEGDGIVDPLFNGVDDNADNVIDNETTPKEFEIEKFDGTLGMTNNPLLQSTFSYTIYRRPMVSPGAREVTLPAGVVIDLTTWNAPTATIGVANYNGPSPLLPERSRLPVDPYTNFVDIMIAPNGQVVQSGAGGTGGAINTLAPMGNQPFYHFWLTEREGVVPTLWGTKTVTLSSNVNVAITDKVGSIPNINPNFGPVGPTSTAQNYLLPMPQGTLKYTGVNLTGERRLVTLFVKTGQIVSNSIQNFNGSDTNAPFYDAQAGLKEAQ